MATALLALEDQSLLVAFGGRAFDLEPALAESTPGRYLGRSLRDAVATIDRLVRER